MSNHIAKNPSIKLVLGHLSFEPFLSRHVAFASSYLNFIKQFVVDPKECRSTMYLSMMSSCIMDKHDLEQLFFCHMYGEQFYLSVSGPCSRFTNFWGTQHMITFLEELGRYQAFWH